MSLFQRLRSIFGTRKFRYTGITLLVLFLLYTVFGFFILPRIIQTQAREFAANKLHRTLSIDKVEINPFTLLATIRGFKLMEEKDAGVFLSFDALTIKVSGQSLLHFAPVVKEVLLVKPGVHVVREDAHRYNFDALLNDLAGTPKAEPADQKPAQFSVYNIQIEDGHFEFVDKPKQTTQVVSDFRLGVPFISSLPSEEEVFVEPLLQAKINGAPLRLAGKARPYAETREATVDLNLDDVDLTRYLEYLPFEPQFKMPSARLDIHVSANFQQAKGHAPALLLSGGAKLKALQINDLNGKSALALPELDVTLGKSDIFNRHVDIASVKMDGLALDLAHENDGRFNLQRMFDTAKGTNEGAAPVVVPPDTQGIAKGAAATKPPAAPAALADSPTALLLKIEDFSIQNASLHYADPQQAMQANLSKFSLSVNKTEVDLGKRSITVAEIASHSADTQLALGVRPASTPSSVSAPAAKPATTPDQAAFVLTLAKVALDNWSARIDDHSHTQAATTVLTPLSFSLQNFTTAPAALSDIDLKATINKTGQLAIGGKVGMKPLHTDLTLDLKNVDLLGAQPYITDKVNLLLTSANLTAKGGLKLDQGADNAMHGGFKGDVKVGDLATIDKISGDDFLNWKSLALSGMDVKLAPFALSIDQVTLGDFFSRVIVDSAGHINLQDIVRSDPGDKKSLTSSSPDAKSAPATPPPPPPPASATATTAPTPIKIGKLLLQKGQVRYTDNFITPHYTANLMDLGGSVGGLSSDPASRASVDLHGQVNDAPLTIAGAINPLKGDLSLDIKAKVTGMELAPLSPYSGRYVGYGIEEGKLSFEVAYQIDQRKLTAQNRLILDQLTFGQKVDSPQALKLPVQFAVALLRDRNGVIDINLPIGGSLDDPQFSVGGLIVKVIVNVIEKAVTEPFALLGSMFGGGKEISTVAFEPGSYTVTPESIEKLDKLAKALNERPALKLEMTGWTNPETDRPILKRAALDGKLRALKAKDLAGRNVSNEDQIVVSEQEYPALLKRAYAAEKFAKPRNQLGIAKDLPVADMEKLMLDNITVTNDDLTSLGDQREEAVKQWMLTNGKIPGERMFMLASKSGAPEVKDGKPASAGRVDFSLR